ncbi:SUMO-conjugating enzyme SCE1-like [Salvia splendens]|uniref:SUMO-conjugating enzyme SCE1-like n=1 Tax=Salvia splendens TaxID=180675 RepID=UPI001C27C774|nr:SUMO-conjugating enzyme SCE1-like [Salvia splendens]
MSGGITLGRLTEVRKAWRKNHPHGFLDGVALLKTWISARFAEFEFMLQYFVWQTDWEGGFYPLTMHFSEDYPSKLPKCKFPPNFFHPNIYPSGTVCLSILSEDSGWRPAISVKQVLIGIQDLLDQPNPSDPAQTDGYQLYMQQPEEYKRRVRQQAKQYPSPV